MAALQDVLTIPPGWSLVNVATPANLGSIDPNSLVEVESADFLTFDIFGIEQATPNVADQLHQQAQQHGSAVYMVALIKNNTAPNNCVQVAGLPIPLPGVSCTQYRWIIVHQQFQALAVLLGVVVLLGLAIVWYCNNQPATQPCGPSVQAFAKDTLQQMCDIFGAGCALQALGTLLIAFSVASIGLAGVLFFLESGIAQRFGAGQPRLPAIPQPVGLQPPRISTTIGAPGVGPSVRVATGGRGGRRRGLGGGGTSTL